MAKCEGKMWRGVNINCLNVEVFLKEPSLFWFLGL